MYSMILHNIYINRNLRYTNKRRKYNTILNNYSMAITLPSVDNSQIATTFNVYTYLGPNSYFVIMIPFLLFIIFYFYNN